ncbi:DUF4136 domain-containing protein [Mangrovivirga sp. M17]|uniref:DUF4136 domain-containing protein n=1 Tax=Mangrovivirga halotolerans TaxID=2993936 RepID=A0ABT3RRY7_9BACT|nr:DUF4136 domain-containing protein [Mangrovivirga halotolerans]MCX2743935.1 DUF4136 domain-containing protein [Mangrovivirga halotolerans]
MRKYIFKTIYFSIILMLTISFISCQPGGAEYVSDLDVVLTDYDDQFDFNSVNTYAIPDEIVEIESNDPGNGDQPDFLDPVFAEPILNKINENMQNNGWQRVDEDQNPDVVVFPSYTTTTNLFYYYDWWYWDWWYPGYGPGWGWWYPYPPVVTGYTTGSVLIQMTDANNTILNDQIPVLWTMIVNGLLQGSNASIIQRINTSIDQGFEQSPYLNN